MPLFIRIVGATCLLLLGADGVCRGNDLMKRLRELEEENIPKTIRVDNGSELVSRDMDLWVY